MRTGNKTQGDPDTVVKILFAMVWDGNRDAAGVRAALHDDMTSAPAYLDEPVLLKDPTDLASRQDAKPTHASLRSSL